ncbi:MAG TPA: hypothetical protein VKL99_09515, partial [Candidatus Angelobacter sp.]|nr:hypothetical protein [Candidatus Angelobacter sp.]
GSYLAHYLVRHFYEDLEEKSLNDILLIAISAMNAVKEYDDACGGATDVVVLSNDGTIPPVTTLEIGNRESYSSSFRFKSDHLFMDLWNANTDAKVRRTMREFQKSIKGLLLGRELLRQQAEQIVTLLRKYDKQKDS